MDDCELTILMPCLNEAETLAVCIAKAKHFLLSSQIQGEIIIVDNGSTDNTKKIVETAITNHTFHQIRYIYDSLYI